MAKRYSESEIKRQLAARQGRSARGTFLPLKPEDRVSAVRASRVGIGLVESANAGRDPLAVSASVLLREAESLYRDAAFAESAEAKEIYAKIQVIRRLAKKTANADQVSAKLDDIISPVEDQLRKKASFYEYLKERFQNFKKTLPERIAARVPVVGGILGGFLRQRREAEEELGKYEKGLLRRNDMGGRSGEMGGARASSIPDLMGDSIGGKGVSSTLGAIYKEITKIRSLVENKFSKVESDSAEIRAREQELEGKNVVGGKVSKDAAKMVMGEGGGGFLSSLLSTLLGSTLGPMLMNGIAALGPMIMGAVGAIGPVLMTAIAGLGSAIAAIGSTLLTVAIPALVATVGAAIGGGLAWLINSGIDAIFGTNLSELMFDKDTWTFADMERDRKFEEAEKAAAEKQQRETSTPEYIAAMSQDPRRLPKLLEDKKITGAQALDALASYEASYGPGDDTKQIRERIMAIDPTAMPSASAASEQGKFAAINAAQSATAAATIPSVSSTVTSTNTSDQSTTVGVLSATTPNTTAGKMLNQYSAEQAALSDAQSAAVGSAAPTISNSSVNTRVSNVVNNFNDDLRIRNNEPTQKQMQTFSLVP